MTDGIPNGVCRRDNSRLDARGRCYACARGRRRDAIREEVADLLSALACRPIWNANNIPGDWSDEARDLAHRAVAEATGRAYDLARVLSRGGVQPTRPEGSMRSYKRRRSSAGRFVPVDPNTATTKRSVSVTAATLDRLQGYAADSGDAIAWIVDDAIAPVFSMSPEEQQALVERVRAGMQVARRRKVAPVVEVPEPVVAAPAIPFWLLPTGGRR